MKVAIVTVNYNGKKDTLELLTSLKLLDTWNVESKVIVVDNGSKDGLVSELVKNYPEVDILQNGVNKGFAGGFNRGMDYALIWGADYIFIINNDCAVKDSNLLDELIKTLKSDERIGLVSPKIYFAPGFEFHKDRYSADEVGKVIWYGGGSFDWDNIGSHHRGIDEVDKGKYDSVEEVDFVSGACMLIKRQVIETVGLFDEKLFAYFEDVDFLKRVKEAGFKAFYNGKVAIYHKVSQTAGIGSPITDYFHARNRLIFGMKYASFRTQFALWRQALRLLLFGRSAQRKGVWDFFMGKRGGVNVSHLEGVLDSHEGVLDSHLRGVGKVEYPLKLSICIVSYNTADLTKKLLQSIFKKDSGFDEKIMEVIVLDNGSEDNCKKVIKEYLLASRQRSGPHIQYIQNEENTGFSGGYNKTIRFSKGEYILMLNSDIEVLRNGLKEMLKWAQPFEGQAVLGGKLYFPDGSKQDSAYQLPTIWGAFKEYFLGQKGSYFMYMPALPDERASRGIRVEGLVMACFLIPRVIINKVGYLDEGTFIFFEDIEYSRRLKMNGVPLYFIPTARFIHHHGGSTKKIGKKQAFDFLKKGAIHYHGIIYYTILTFILWLGQKLGSVKTPTSRWTK